jgi:REP-associated tyrosine transposase
VCRPFWQLGGDYDRNITRTSMLRSMIAYLHHHPVRRGLVAQDAQAEDWEWSSARWYAGLRPVPIEMQAMVLEDLSREGSYRGER